MTSTATLHTSLGDIVIELFPNHAPRTVANFVELATGAKEWTDHAQVTRQLQSCTTEQFFTASLTVS
jgi:cyclophilin family peptidyl-prolyl cis-trans isomerase